MDEITFENLLTYLHSLPQEGTRYLSEEIHTSMIPHNWVQIGSLADKRIGINYVMYKPWTNYAIGFYPYSGCDIYKDETGRIILSYIELGGHFPFRRNFFISKNSPFIFEPISFDISIDEDKHHYFFSCLNNYGLSADKIENDILKYKAVDQITHEIAPEETLVIRKYHDSINKNYRYSIITKRENAIKIKADLENKNSF